MSYTNDPVADAMRYYAELEKEQALLPVCEVCKESIDFTYYDIGGEILCYKCLDKKYKKEVTI